TSGCSSRSAPSITGMNGIAEATVVAPHRSASRLWLNSRFSSAAVATSFSVSTVPNPAAVGSTPSRAARSAVTNAASPGAAAAGGGGCLDGAALRDHLREHPGGPPGGQQRGDAHGSGRLAENGDVRGVATEGGDVALHPLQRGDLVQQPAISRRVREHREADR